MTGVNGETSLVLLDSDVRRSFLAIKLRERERGPVVLTDSESDGSGKDYCFLPETVAAVATNSA